MEGIMQRTSSQTNAINIANNSSNSSNVKLSNSKPPILPKPQISKLDCGVPRVVKPNPPPLEFSTAHSKPKSASSENCVSVPNNLVFPINRPSKISEKPPEISPKPQLPPKLHVANLSKPGITSRTLASPTKTNLFLESSLCTETNSTKSTIKVQNKNMKKKENNEFIIQKGLLNCMELPKNLILAKQKSGSLDRKEELNWKVKDLINDEDQLTKFCKQVEMCSKHSHLLKNDDTTLASGKLKKKLEQLDLASNISNVSSSAPFLSDLSTQTNVMSNNSCTNEFSEQLNFVNGGSTNESENFNVKEEKTLNTGESSNLSSSSDIPKSFLHRYINFCNQAKESYSENSDKPVTPSSTSNIQSFLHKNKEQCNLKLTKSKSLGQHDTETSDNLKLISAHYNADKNLTDKEQLFKLDNLKKSALSSSDSSSFSKRFPWFGSFGKGGKKESGKKGRCVSQFYSSSMDMDDQIFQEKNRTKSLPDIKHTRVAPDGSFLLKNSQTRSNSNATHVSSDYPHSDSDDDKDSLNQVEINFDKDSNHARAYLKAKELMTSEEVFIDVLKLLNVDFRNFVQLRNFESRNSCIPIGEVNKILNHLSQLQSLNEDILDDLRKRIQNWENNPKISDVIVKKGAFLKMYTTYIQNFESQTNYLDECTIKYPKFGKIVKEFEASERCKKLSLKHYMLKPVQRIPQYRLLLIDYLKHLDESSPDYQDTVNALKIVCEVVDHANRNVAHGDKEGRLMRFQSILSDYTLIKPGRELIKDGPLEKICRKSVKDRYFILLNDCLLHTTYSKQYLKIHQELPLSGMKVCHNDDQIYPRSFTVHSIKRSFILCAKTELECQNWVNVLQKAIEEHIKKQKTFLNVKIEVHDSFKLGKEAPVWVPDSKVTMCQICTAEFTALFRRHHCRGCGKVVCRMCGSNQAPLQYTNFKPDRVCDQCFDLLLREYEDSKQSICRLLKETLNLNDQDVESEYFATKIKFIKYSSASSLKKSKYIPPRLKEVSANDSESTISGWLYRKSRKSWKMFWYVLKDHVLYVYKASEDVLALSTIPVLGYVVERATVNDEDVDKNLIFSLVHQSQSPLVFRAESQSSANRWVEALIAASNFDYLDI